MPPDICIVNRKNYGDQFNWWGEEHLGLVIKFYGRHEMCTGLWGTGWF